MKSFRVFVYVLCVLLATFIALNLRLRAVELLPIDYDEDDYLGAAQRYAQAMRAGDLQAIIDYEFNYEHPPLTKLLYGLAIAGLPEAPLIPERPSTDAPASVLPEPHFDVARKVSAALGTLEVLALALLNPLAGLLLGIHTWQIKYTSQIMLEPLPALTSLLVVLFYFRARQSEKRAVLWLGLSALMLGITAASKYTYAIVGVAVLADWLWDAYSPRRADQPKGSPPAAWGQIFFWGLFAIIIFFAFNPRLWADPLERLSQSVFYHGGYAQSEHVRRAGFPPWQQLVWLAGPVPWHPDVFRVTLDLYILIFASVGFKRFWQRYRVFALWLLLAGIFLLLWPTKWPQYVLTLTAPLSLSAAMGVQTVLQNIRTRPRPAARAPILWRELRRAWPWLLPGLVVLALIAFYPMIFQAAMSLTDFNTISIRDGINGGVWREVWRGITGQTEPLVVDLWQYFDRFRRPTSTDVHYVGFSSLRSLFAGGIPDLLVFNILWAVLSVFLQAALGIAVALMLNREGVRGRGFWRTLFVLPWAIPEFVGALIWLRLLEPGRGWLAVIENAPFDVWLATFWAAPGTRLLLLLLAATWYGFPFIMLAATAGLKLISSDVYEAAAIDGAGRWQQFHFVTWPLLWPLVMPAVLIRLIFAFNQFYLFYTMRVDFPTVTHATLSYYAFSPTFGGQFAVSAAINIFTVVVLVVLILWFNRRSRAVEGVTYA
jgi:ABC-type sugar transport system permease subunit